MSGIHILVIPVLFVNARLNMLVTGFPSCSLGMFSSLPVKVPAPFNAYDFPSAVSSYSSPSVYTISLSSSLSSTLSLSETLSLSSLLSLAELSATLSEVAAVSDSLLPSDCFSLFSFDCSTLSCFAVSLSFRRFALARILLFTSGKTCGYAETGYNRQND